MPQAFWSNTFWFILLGALAVIQIIMALSRTRHKKMTFALFLAVSGMTFSIEALICCFLKAYSYRPMIFPDLIYEDEITGNLFSQFLISSTAILIAVYHVKIYWIALIAGIYGLIEELFLYLGVYSHNWYRTWMTVIGVSIIFVTVRWLYRKVIESLNPRLKYVLTFFGMYTLHIILVKWPFKLMGILLIRTDLLYDTLSSYAVTFLANLFVIVIPCMMIYFSRLRWWYKLLFLFALCLIPIIALAFNLIGIKDGWTLLFPAGDVFGAYLFVFALDKCFTPKYVFRVSHY